MTLKRGKHSWRMTSLKSIWLYFLSWITDSCLTANQTTSALNMMLIFWRQFVFLYVWSQSSILVLWLLILLVCLSHLMAVAWYEQHRREDLWQIRLDIFYNLYDLKKILLFCLFVVIYMSWWRQQSKVNMVVKNTIIKDSIPQCDL